MRLLLPEWSALAVFFALVLAAALYALVLSVHFPAEHRRPALRSALGTAVLWTTALVTFLSIMAGVRMGWAALPGPVAVLAGGAAVLAAPMALKPFPDSLIDSRAGLVLFAALAGVLALLSLRY